MIRARRPRQLSLARDLASILGGLLVASALAGGAVGWLIGRRR